MRTEHIGSKKRCDRIVLIVMDSCGCGASIDAEHYGDEGSNTLGNVSRAVGGMYLPHFASLGLSHITPIVGTEKPAKTKGAYGRMQEHSAGKDTTTGHFEIAGLVTKTPLPTFQHGFPEELLLSIKKATGRGILGDQAASGTHIIEELGEQHIATGDLIIYSSADSVLQIAAHEEVIPLPVLYQIGEMVRELCNPYHIARVILRPFVGKKGSFQRTYHRRDLSMKPAEDTVLDAVSLAGLDVIGIGKIWDIFSGQGVTKNVHTEGNTDGLAQILESLRTTKEGLIFCNLVDFDMLYGHRRDPKGYARALLEMDAWIPKLLESISDRDLVMMTADHGNDPTFAGSDHTREDVPILAFSKQMPSHEHLGVRKGFYDIAQTICEGFGLDPWRRGKSFLNHVLTPQSG